MPCGAYAPWVAISWSVGARREFEVFLGDLRRERYSWRKPSRLIRMVGATIWIWELEDRRFLGMWGAVEGLMAT